MIDQAGIMMAQGSAIACERISGVNGNMSQFHYHEYFELYYLETGERFHMIHDQLYCIRPGEFILFPPYLMHHSYGAGYTVPWQGRGGIYTSFWKRCLRNRTPFQAFRRKP